MPAFRPTFTHRHAILAVIHAESEDQVLRNARCAYDNGCDGVFLINHTGAAARLLQYQRAVVRTFPDWWAGVNCLDLAPGEVFKAAGKGGAPPVDGVWTDNAAIDERSEAQPAAERLQDERQRSGWRGLYFGGVAFKYQRTVADLARAAQLAPRYMDVVTTSGPATGTAASLDKLRVMKEALGVTPLAIASGVTPANVTSYLPLVDCLLVATGISRSFSELAPELVADLVSRVRAYGAAVEPLLDVDTLGGAGAFAYAMYREAHRAERHIFDYAAIGKEGEERPLVCAECAPARRVRTCALCKRVACYHHGGTWPTAHELELVRGGRSLSCLCRACSHRTIRGSLAKHFSGPEEMRRTLEAEAREAPACIVPPGGSPPAWYSSPLPLAALHPDARTVVRATPNDTWWNLQGCPHCGVLFWELVLK